MHRQFVSPKLVILFPVRICSWFASSRVCANANLIVITPEEQTGAKSIVNSAGTVTRKSSFTKPGFKNQTTPKQTITRLYQVWRFQHHIFYIPPHFMREHPCSVVVYFDITTRLGWEIQLQLGKATPTDDKQYNFLTILMVPFTKFIGLGNPDSSLLTGTGLGDWCYASDLTVNYLQHLENQDRVASRLCKSYYHQSSDFYALKKSFYAHKTCFFFVQI